MVGVLIILLIVWLLSRSVSPQEETAAPVVTEALTPEPTPEPEPAPSPETLAETNLKEQLRRESLIFTEKFGSYSSQSQLDNVVDLYPMMTETMQIWAKGYVSDLRKQFASAKNYEGISTRVISVKFKSLDLETGRADVEIITQREKTTALGQLTPEVYYQNFRLEFVRLEAGWKIDGAFWEKKT